MTTNPQFPDPLNLRQVIRPGATASIAGPDLPRRVANLEQGAAGRPGPGVTDGSALIADISQPGWSAWVAPVNARAFRSAAGSFTTSAWTVVALDGESHDSATLHDIATNSSRITVPSAGLYRVHGQIGFASNTTGYRVGGILKNSAGTYSGANRICVKTAPPVNGDGTFCPVGADIRLAAGDYVELFGWQNSGITLGLAVGTDQTFLELTRISS